MTADTGPLIEHIRASLDGGGDWRVSAGDLAGLLGVDTAEFYRGIYGADADQNSPVALRMATDAFGPENAGELVSVVELFAGEEAEHELFRAGVFLPHEHQVEVLARFLEEAAMTVRAHRHRRHDFSGMLRTARGYDAALRTYLDTYLRLEEIIDRTVEGYCREAGFGIPNAGRVAVKTVIEVHLRRRILREEAIYALVIALLWQQAMDEGYAPAAEDRREAEADGPEDHTARARSVLGLPAGDVSRSLLRHRYRELMKRFHPDVNPQGLERSKEINAAYSVLAEGLAARGAMAARREC